MIVCAVFLEKRGTQRPNTPNKFAVNIVHFTSYDGVLALFRCNPHIPTHREDLAWRRLHVARSCIGFPGDFTNHFTLLLCGRWLVDVIARHFVSSSFPLSYSFTLALKQKWNQKCCGKVSFFLLYCDRAFCFTLGPVRVRSLENRHRWHNRYLVLTSVNLTIFKDEEVEMKQGTHKRRILIQQNQFRGNRQW